MVPLFSFEKVMKVGDLAKVGIYGSKYCIITGIIKDPKFVSLQIELFFFTGVQRHWCVAAHNVEVINECG